LLLGAYALAVVLFAALATKDLVASAAAGVFLLLRQPYGIGDEVRVAGERGIVQEVDLFVTRIEADGEGAWCRTTRCSATGSSSFGSDLPAVEPAGFLFDSLSVTEVA